MIGLSALERPEVQQLVNQGSPKLLSMVGRAFGLGQAEQQALVKGQFPTWLFLAAGLAVGFVVGIETEKRWPGKVLGGKGKR
jgi:hypothetical protein